MLSLTYRGPSLQQMFLNRKTGSIWFWLTLTLGGLKWTFSLHASALMFSDRAISLFVCLFFPVVGVVDFPIQSVKKKGGLGDVDSVGSDCYSRMTSQHKEGLFPS